MRKLISLFMFLSFITLGGSAFAEDVNVLVSPELKARFFDDVDTSIAAGVNAEVGGLFPGVSGLKLLGGFEVLGAETDILASTGAVDLSIATVRAGVEYAYPVSESVTLKPYATLDFIFADADGTFEATNDVGRSIGVNVEYQIRGSVSLFAGLGHQWLDTRVSSPGDSQILNLDNVNMTFGVAIKV